MPLFQVQDVDRPLWVIAKDMPAALAMWQAVIAKENPGEPASATPQGVAFICDDDELLLPNRVPGQVVSACKHGVPAMVYCGCCGGYPAAINFGGER